MKRSEQLESALRGLEEKPLFQVRELNYKGEWINCHKIWADGRIEGFGTASLIGNMIPIYAHLIAAKAIAEAEESELDRQRKPLQVALMAFHKVLRRIVGRPVRQTG